MTWTGGHITRQRELQQQIAPPHQNKIHIFPLPKFKPKYYLQPIHALRNPNAKKNNPKLHPNTPKYYSLPAGRTWNKYSGQSPPHTIRTILRIKVNLARNGISTETLMIRVVASKVAMFPDSEFGVPTGVSYALVLAHCDVLDEGRIGDLVG